MSLTPLESSAPARKKDEDPFSENRKLLYKMIEEGKSWSGRERNCCFLNTGGGQFANISATSGFDFLDDARGLALVDWDHDGDLDLWITNRTAPRVRVMRNGTPSGNHFLAVRLEGRTSNRDAIGARVELTLEGSDQKLIKTVRAGEGFLAQSSKWLHFGLGTAGRIERLVVRWPDGKVEPFAGLDVDTRYWIVQGTGTADVWTPPARKVQLATSDPTLPNPTNRSATRLTTPLPLPRLDYTTFDGQSVLLAERRNKPLLVNLWASWCRPCVAELTEFTKHAEDLRTAGLDVLLLSVDGLGDDSTTPDDAQNLLARLGVPFDSGVATVALLDKLQIIHDQLFSMRRPLPVPTSILVDTQGQMAVIYKGPVTIDRLLDDVDQLSRDEVAWRRGVAPFAGRWHHFPETSLLHFVGAFFDQGYVDEAIQYAFQNKPRMAGESKFPELLHRVGRELASRGDLDTAIAQFREALGINADDFQAHNNLGVALRLQGKLDEAIEHLRRAAQLSPDDADVHANLALALQSQGKLDEAIRHLRRAAELRPDDATTHNSLGGALLLAKKTGEAIGPVRRALELQPDLVSAHHNMAILLMLQKQPDQAIAHWREAIRINPDHAHARYLLGNALQTQGKVDEAIEQFRQAARLLPDLADVHNALGVLHARQQHWDEAIVAFNEALRLQPGNAEYRRKLTTAQARKRSAGAP